MIPFYEKSDHNIRAFQTYGMNFPAHLHVQLELVYVLEGKIQMTIQDMEYTFYKGDFILIFPNTIHSYSSSFTMNALNNSVLTVISGVMLAGEYLNTLMNYRLRKPYIRSKNLHDDVVFAMNALVKEMNDSKSLYVSKAYLQLILARTIPSLELVKYQSLDSHDLAHRIVNYISLCFREPLSLDILATELGISRYYLSRVFSSKLNSNFNDYVNNIRVSYASTLILTTDMSITQICNDAGFNSLRTFNRVFKDNFHMTPSEYRYRNKQE